MQQHHIRLAAALALVLGGGVSAAIAADPPATVPVVQGGDFEAAFTSVADIAATWTPWGIDTQQVTAGITRDESDPHGGQASLRVFRPADPREWRGVVVNSPFTNALQPRPTPAIRSPSGPGPTARGRSGCGGLLPLGATDRAGTSDRVAGF